MKSPSFFMCWTPSEAVYPSKLKRYTTKEEALENARDDQFVSSNRYAWTGSENDIVREPLTTFL